MGSYHALPVGQGTTTCVLELTVNLRAYTDFEVVNLENQLKAQPASFLLLYPVMSWT